MPESSTAQLEELWQSHLASIRRTAQPRFRIGGTYTREEIYASLLITADAPLGSLQPVYLVIGKQLLLLADISPEGDIGGANGFKWQGDMLLWQAEQSFSMDGLLSQAIDAGCKTLIFTRSPQQTHYQFQGHGCPEIATDSMPLRICWLFDHEQQCRPTTLPEEVIDKDEFWEGSVYQIQVNAYERNPEARRICIEHYGWNCCMCGFNFRDFYGELGKDFIHVHHLRELSTIGKKYKIDPIDDLRPVCPNCHAMLHRRHPAWSIEELSSMLSV